MKWRMSPVIVLRLVDPSGRLSIVFQIVRRPRNHVLRNRRTMPAHPVLIETHDHETRSKPAVFEVAVQLWSASLRPEQQTGLSRPCSVGRTLRRRGGGRSLSSQHWSSRYLTIRGRSFSTCCSTLIVRPPLMKWPVSRARASRDSHARGCKHNVKSLFLLVAGSDKFRNELRCERRTLLLRILDDWQVHRIGVPRPLMDWFAVRGFSRLHDLFYGIPRIC